MIKHITSFYKALECSEIPNKEELKREAKCCFDAIRHYVSVVSDEQFYCVEYPYEGFNAPYRKMLEKQRSEAHDAAINACSRLNEISRALNIGDFCYIDINDRKKVAGFCGYIASSLYFYNIQYEELWGKCLESADVYTNDVELSLSVFMDLLTEKLRKRFYDKVFICHDADYRGDKLCLDYEDPEGCRQTISSDISFEKTDEPGYLNKLVDRFFWDIVTTYLAKEVKENEQIPGPPETQEKMKKLLQVFNAEFSHWSKYRLEELEGNSNRLIQEICQLMCDEFYTRTWALTDLIVPIDQNELEEKLKTWSDEYQFSYEERDPDRYQKSWCLSKEGVSSTLDVNLTDEGSVFVVQVKQIDKNTSRHCLSDAYTIDVVESEIRRWLNNKV